MLPRPSGGFYKLAAATSSPIVNNADARLWRTSAERCTGAGQGRRDGPEVRPTSWKRRQRVTVLPVATSRTAPVSRSTR